MAYKECTSCGGNGNCYDSECHRGKHVSGARDCRICDGSGDCRVCDGTGLEYIVV